MTIRVAIHSPDPEAGQVLCRRLAGPGLEVRVLAGQKPEPSPHVVVVLPDERHVRDVRRPCAMESPTWTSRTQAEPHAPAVVWLGGESRLAGPLEVHLPAEVAPELLALVCQLLGQIVQLEQRWRLEAESRVQLAAQAMRDPLTGLPNRRAWDSVLARRLAQAGAARRLCLAILDLDHFKQVNDARGHPAGDQLLRTAGQILSRQLRSDDFVARFGGDEFGLLLWVPNDTIAQQVIERVRRALPEMLARAGLDRVTASAGYVVLPWVRAAAAPAATADPALAAEALYEAADRAMRLAKQQGRDRSLAAAVG